MIITLREIQEIQALCQLLVKILVTEFIGFLVIKMAHEGIIRRPATIVGQISDGE